MKVIANTLQIFMILRLHLPGLIVVLSGRNGLLFKCLPFGHCCRFRFKRIFFSGLRHVELFFNRCGMSGKLYTQPAA